MDTEKPLDAPRSRRRSKDQFDQPWKTVIESQLAQFLAFFAPKAYEQIDWERKPVSLNTELRRWRRDNKAPDRRADSLFEVYLKEPGELGDEQFVLIHLEVQTTEEAEFAERMFEYGYRAWDRHRRRLAAIAVLGDLVPSFRPNRFGWSLWDTEMNYRFPVVKLLEYRDRRAELEASTNIFAVVVLAFLDTQDTRDDPDARLASKWRLVRLLYERRYSREEIVALFNLIDWMMALPEQQAIIFETDLESLEVELNMPYLNSIERRALQRGIEQGIERGISQGIERGIERGISQGIERGLSQGIERGLLQGRQQQLKALLEHRFGPLPGWSLDRLNKGTSSLLDSWALRLLDARALEDVFR